MKRDTFGLPSWYDETRDHRGFGDFAAGRFTDEGPQDRFIRSDTHTTKTMPNEWTPRKPAQGAEKHLKMAQLLTPFARSERLGK